MKTCPFCGSKALVKNDQNIPVCNHHRDEKLDDMKCACGKYLEIRHGKYGPFFNCIDCGTIGYKKGLKLNDYPLESIEDL